MLLLFAAAMTIPLGLDLYLPVPEEIRSPRKSIELGRRLFFDRRLSRDGSISCASCHDPERAFSDGRAGRGRRVRSQGPPQFSRAHQSRLRPLVLLGRARWPLSKSRCSSRSKTRNEMDLPLSEAAARVSLTPEEISRALASYVRSILSGDSPFDRFINGDRTALSAEQQAGLATLSRQRRTAPPATSVRTSPMSDCTTPASHGATANSPISARASGNFKTPTLREIARTAPYMHDGSLATLEDVIEYYDRGGNRNSCLDPELRPLHLSVDERRALLAFLRSLSGKLQHGQ